MSNVTDFIKADFAGTLFPLKTNLLLAEKHESELSHYIYQQVVDDANDADAFLPQSRVYATKPRNHLRRTVKLDPVAEFFLYDIVYRNRAVFRPEASSSRKSFGYRFKDGSHVPVHSAYSEYKQSLTKSEGLFKHKIQFDIAAYFNSLYHHDVVHWFAGQNGVSPADSNALGQFFREINAGRSVDFLPQGIYPSKMIGNEFLKLVDLSGQLKSAMLVRFMDDFTLFDNDADIIRQDFLFIQQLLGQYGLNVNPSKTHIDRQLNEVEGKLSEIKKSLKGMIAEVEVVNTASSTELVEVHTEVELKLSAEQIGTLISMLKDESLEESDADQILGFLRSHSDSILERIPDLLRRFPNLTKHLYSTCRTISEKKELAEALLEFVKKESAFLEYQLFWLVCIVEDQLMEQDCHGELLIRLFELSREHTIARAKILEIPENGFGIKEIRGGYLKTGQSDWLSWASAIGSRTMKAAERNYALKYFSKGSPMNFIIAECAKKF
jgi:hypothetical protein